MAAMAAAEAISRAHPSLPAWLHSQQAASEVLAEQHAFLQHLAQAGVVVAVAVVLVCYCWWWCTSLSPRLCVFTDLNACKLRRHNVTPHLVSFTIKITRRPHCTP
jgi:hypothetical protein